MSSTDDGSHVKYRRRVSCQVQTTGLMSSTDDGSHVKYRRRVYKIGICCFYDKSTQYFVVRVALIGVRVCPGKVTSLLLFQNPSTKQALFHDLLIVHVMK
jgi:hypothetical protein